MRKISALFVLLVVFSCKKKVNPPCPSGEYTNGFLVLCEGLFQHNNSTLDWHGLNGNTINQVFAQVNNRPLGDTGNDLLHYGSKIYILTSVSSTIEVVNEFNLVSQKQILMQVNGVSKQPRQMAAYGGKVYVTCFDGFVDVIDTVSLELVNRIQVGSNPEGICISDDKAFVTNSGGLNQIKDSTVSVIDLNSENEISRLVVGLNPGQIIATNEGLFCVTRGDYQSIPSNLVKLNSTTLQVENNYGFELSGVTDFGNYLLVSKYDFGTSSSQVKLFDKSTATLGNNDFLNILGVTTLYGVEVLDNQIVVFDANGYTSNGSLHTFDLQGNYTGAILSGLNPSSILKL